MGKKRKKDKGNRQGDQRREGQKEEERRGEEIETGSVQKSCVGSVSVEAFEFFCQGGDLESCGGLSWENSLENLEDWSDCEPHSSAHVRVVPDVTDVPVSPSSGVTELCDVFSFCSDWEFVEPQSSSFFVPVRRKG